MAGKAEKSGVKVADLIVTAIRSVVADNPRRIVLRDQVENLVKQGIPDPVISHRLRISITQVGSMRRALNLKPIKFRREMWEHELMERLEGAA